MLDFPEPKGVSLTTALIIVPTYNEVENIERLVKEIRSQIGRAHV